MSPDLWYTLVGALLVSIALMGALVRDLPLTTTMCYFLVGIACGPLGFSLVYINPGEQAWLLLRVAEIALILSLFSAGLKLRLPLSDRAWWIPIRLGMVSMVFTVGLIALIGVFFLGLSPGLAILVGGILAPTDPVLASAVQVRGPDDNNKLRFSLTAEAGMNDGTAFPFVMLGLGLLGLHELGGSGIRWFLVDVLWAAAGIGLGGLIGRGAGELVVYLRRRFQAGFGYDEFFSIGLIALTYGIALLVGSNGFLAVFAAAVALRNVERRHAPEAERARQIFAGATGDEELNPATHPEVAAVHMAEESLKFSEQIERIVEVVLVLLLGLMLLPAYLSFDALWFIPVLLFIVRPLSVLIGLDVASVNLAQRGLISWLGIRGIGSIYYLMYSIDAGIAEDLVNPLAALVILTVAVSILLHGVTSTPLMNFANRHLPTRLNE